MGVLRKSTTQSLILKSTCLFHCLAAPFRNHNAKLQNLLLKYSMTTLTSESLGKHPEMSLTLIHIKL